MLTKPDLPDDRLAACLLADFGLTADHVEFLPLGGDLGTAVYRVKTRPDRSLRPVRSKIADTYFCKLRRGAFDPTTVALPRYLSDNGVEEIIPPQTTGAGRLWAELDDYSVILYPFVAGVEGYLVELSESQWAQFGTAMRRIHMMPVPAALTADISREDYSPEWREECCEIMDRLAGELPDDAITQGMVDLLAPRREEVLAAVARADELAQVLVRQEAEFVLCHGDIHPGNLLVTAEGFLYIVDWDYPVLAPRERDLMFIGGGQGFLPFDAARETELFYRGYDDVEVNQLALVYYRYERGLKDLVVESSRILSPTVADDDRAQSLEYLGYYCVPDNTLAIAAAADGR